jgi:membrane protease subunit HflC
MMKRVPVPTLIVALVLIAVFAFYTFTFQVRFNESAVKVRFGKADESSVVKDPGLHFRWPIPIERVVHYDTRLRVLDTPEGEIKTKDGTNIVIGCYALYRIKDPLTFLRSAANESEVEKQMRSRLDQARQSVVGRFDMSALVNLDEQVLDEAYNSLESALIAEAKEEVDKTYGVELVSFEIRRISLPKDATQKVFEAMSNERARFAKNYRQQGQSESQRITSQAQADRVQIMQFVKRRAQEIISVGVQQATKKLAEIEDTDREFYVWLRKLEALKASLAQRATVFLDVESPLYSALMNPSIGRTDEQPVSARDLATSAPMAASEVSSDEPNEAGAE